MTRDGYNLYCLYVALTRHFSAGSYDFFKYNGKINVSTAHYEKRNDMYTFEKVARVIPAADWQDYLVSNIIASDKPWIRNMNADVMQHWRLKISQMPITFRGDVRSMLTSYEPHEIAAGPNLPPIATLTLRGHIALESVVLINAIIDFADSPDIKDDIKWPSFRNKIKQYQPFVLQKLPDISYYSDIMREELLERNTFQHS